MNGKELIKLGFSPGRAVGTALCETKALDESGTAFGGLPVGRNADSGPSFLEVRACQATSPNGRPFITLSLTACSSAAVWASFTHLGR